MNSCLLSKKLWFFVKNFFKWFSFASIKGKFCLHRKFNWNVVVDPREFSLKEIGWSVLKRLALNISGETHSVLKGWGRQPLGDKTAPPDTNSRIFYLLKFLKIVSILENDRNIGCKRSAVLPLKISISFCYILFF